MHRQWDATLRLSSIPLLHPCTCPGRCKCLPVRSRGWRFRATARWPGDSEYLAWLDNALSSGLRQFEPELICYIAGADPYKEDQLGGLNLTIEGLQKRDELVFRAARARNVPVMVTFAGGYSKRLYDTVRIHRNTVAAARDVFAIVEKNER